MRAEDIDLDWYESVNDNKLTTDEKKFLSIRDGAPLLRSRVAGDASQAGLAHNVAK